MTTITVLPLSALRESPTNPRQTFEPAKLEELAESLRTVGILQPVVVRPVTADCSAYEIVMGHRRCRAAEMAGLDVVPCIVTAMTDEQVAVAQIHENAKRADVHPVEEGAGYARLVSDFGKSVADLIGITGKNRAYLYGRLKLATLQGRARQACLSGLIDAEVGLLIARYCRAEKAQDQAVQEITYLDFDADRGLDNHPPRRCLSYRDAKLKLRNTFCLRLISAAWDRDDATFPGAPACSTCPKLAGNDADLADAFDADVCTDAACYTRKGEVHVERLIQVARALGDRVLQGDAAKALRWPRYEAHPRDYIAMNDTAFLRPVDGDDAAEAMTFAEALQGDGRDGVTPVLVLHPDHAPMTVLTEPDARLVLRRGVGKGWHPAPEWDDLLEMDDGSATAGSASTRPASERVPEFSLRNNRGEWFESLSPAERAVCDPDSWGNVRRAIALRVRHTARTVDDLRDMVDQLLDLIGVVSDDALAGMGWLDELQTLGKEYQDEVPWVRAKLPALDGADLAALLVLLTIVDDQTPRDRRAQQRLAVARRYGVETVVEAAAVDFEDQPAEREAA